MPISRSEAARLVLEREAATASYEAWCRYALKPQGLEPGPHHQIVIEAVDRIMRGEDRRLMLIAPPGSAKSMYGTRLFPGYFFQHNPNGRLIGASHTEKLASGFSNEAMGFILECGEVLDYRLATDAAAEWSTTNGGSYVAAGVGRRIAGKRADVALVDDPVGSAEDIATLDQRDKMWVWYWRELVTRTKPGGRIILIMTRWHEDDLAGRLLNNGGDQWRVVHIKAECEGIEGDPLGRAPGEFLKVPGYDYEGWLKEQKRDLESNGRLSEWYSLYQGSPRAPDGNIFKVEKIATVEAEPAGFRWVRAWDLASSKGKGDYTVGAKLGLGQHKELCIADIVRLQGGPDEVRNAIVNTAKRDGVSTLVSLPKDPGQAGAGQVLYLTRELMGYRVVSSPETGDKETRASPFAAQVNVGNVSMVRAWWNRVLVDELAGFPAAKHDDQVDALSRASAELIVPAPPARMMKFDFMRR